MPDKVIPLWKGQWSEADFESPQTARALSSQSPQSGARRSHLFQGLHFSDLSDYLSELCGLALQINE